MVGHLKLMKNKIFNRSSEEWNLIGESICKGKDWRWVALWAYNIHRLFKNHFPARSIWRKLDSLISKEWDWHTASDLFELIRRTSLKSKNEQAEDLYFHLGEIVTKSLSNASWYPGLYDYNAPWKVPFIAMQIAQLLDDAKLTEFLNYHFISLSQNLFEFTKRVASI